MKKLTATDISERVKVLESADGLYLALAQQWALEAYRELRENVVTEATSTSSRDFAGETEASRPSVSQGAVPARRGKAGVLTDMDDKIEQRLRDVDKVDDVHLLREWLKEHLRDNRATRAWMRVWRKNTKNINSEIDVFLEGEAPLSQDG